MQGSAVTDRTEHALRVILFVAGAAFTILGLGYSLRMDWAVRAHLWSDGPLTISWYGSMLLSFGPQLVWLGLTREWGILPGFAAGSIVMFLGAASAVLGVAARERSTHLWIHGALLALLGLGSIWMWRWSRGRSLRDTRPTPVLLRWFGAICVVPLLIASAGLLARHPHVFPWPLNPDSSTVMGWMFLGTGVSFVFAPVQGRWAYMRTLLMGFLVYDAVLIPYYLGHCARVQPEHELSLGIFMVVLGSSALLALFYLFLHPATRW